MSEPSSPEFKVSTYLLSQIIANTFDLNKALISPISTNSLNQAAPRPLKAGLKTKKIEQEFDIKCVGLNTSLNMIKSRLTK